jgi:hypothetical protein
MSRDDYRLRRLVSERLRREGRSTREVFEERVLQLQQEALTPREYAAKLALLQDDMWIG